MGVPLRRPGNWASRVRCRRCGRVAPQRIADAARRADQEYAPTTQTRSGGRQPPGKGGLGAGRQQASSPRPARQHQGEQAQRSSWPVSFAEAVTRLLPAAEALQQGQGDPDDDVRMGEPAAADNPQPEDRRSVELRYWRERRAAAMRAGELGAADAAECDARLAALEEQARAARPWAARVQAATDAQRTAAS